MRSVTFLHAAVASSFFIPIVCAGAPPVPNGSGLPMGVNNPAYYHPKYTPYSFDDQWLVLVPGVPQDSDDHPIQLYDLNTGSVVVTFKGHTESVLHVQLSADRKLMVSAAGRYKHLPNQATKDATVRLWNVATSKEVMRLDGNGERFGKAYLSPDNRRLLTVGGARGCQLWDLATAKPLQEYEFHRARLSPDGRVVLTSDWKPERVTLWDAASGTKQRAIIRHDQFHVDNVSFEPSSRYVITYQLDRNPTLYFWDIVTGKKVQEFVGHTSWLGDATLMPDGKTAISASSDKTVRFWDMSTGKEVRRFDAKLPVQRLLLSPDGKYLYTTLKTPAKKPGGPERSEILWDVETGKRIRESEEVNFVGFSPDGSRFLTTQSLEDLRTGRSATWFDSKTGRTVRSSR